MESLRIPPWLRPLRGVLNALIGMAGLFGLWWLGGAMVAASPDPVRLRRFRAGADPVQALDDARKRRGGGHDLAFALPGRRGAC